MMCITRTERTLGGPCRPSPIRTATSLRMTVASPTGTTCCDSLDRTSSRVGTRSVSATRFEAMALPSDRFAVDGQSLFILAFAPERVSADRPIFCSIFQLLSGRKNFFTRSVRTDKHVLVYEALSDHVELYDAVTDPPESQDLAQGSPETVEELRELLRASATGNLWEVRRFQ